MSGLAPVTLVQVLEMFGVSMSTNRIAESLTWLGGGEWRELGERHERSTHVIAGVVVLLGAALAWLVSTLAVAEARHMPMAVVVPLTLVFGLLVGSVSRAIASGPTPGWSGIVGRAFVAIAVGVVVGELAAVVLFSGSIGRARPRPAGTLRTRRRGGRRQPPARRGPRRRAL